MTEKHKNYNIVYYCVGWSLDGPIYAKHFVSTEKPKHTYQVKKDPIVMSGKSMNRWFKHKHND